MLAPAAAAERLGVTTQTLRNWAKLGKIKCSFTPGGDARYHIGAINDASCGLTPANAPKQVSVIYARVSSSKQKADLQRQIDFLRAKFPDHEVVSDIGSGVNFGRKGLVSLLDRCLAGAIKEVVVAHRDRLARIGSDLLEHVILRTGSVLTVHQDPTCPDCYAELGDDLMAIVTHFAAKHHGRRKYK
jgi:putative resolvase